MTEYEHIRHLEHLKEMIEIKSRCEGIFIPFELLKDYYGATMCSIQKNQFLKKFGYCWIEKGVKEAIEEIETFIKNAEGINLEKAFYAGKWGYDTNELRYLRLKYNYYLDHDLKEGDLGICCPLPSVYGKYFLFYEVLKDELKKLMQQEPEPIAEQGMKPINKSFTQKQIAIAYFVMRIQITKDNGEEILKEHSQTTSVPKLLQKVISKASQLTTLSRNKTTDTKHKQDLIAAKRLICGKKNERATTDITRTISVFDTSYERLY